MVITIPPFSQTRLACVGPFSVVSDGQIIGPPSANDRAFTIKTGKDLVEVEVIKNDDDLLTVQASPLNPYEENNGIPCAVSQTVPERTIQEIIAQYVQGLSTREPASPETVEEFLDFGSDEDDDLPPLTAYEQQMQYMTPEVPLTHETRPETPTAPAEPVSGPEGTAEPPAPPPAPSEPETTSQNTQPA